MHNTRSIHTLWPRIREERGNCFLYGCVTLVVLALLGGLIAFIVGRNFIREVREKYTEATPVEIPTIDMPADQIQALIKRVDDYARDLRADKPLPVLTLTEQEVNALLQNHPDLKDIYGGLVYLTLEDGGVTGKLSVALDWFPGMKGRYFNGAATFEVSLQNDDPDIYLKSATFKGEQVPDQYLVQMREQDFADHWDHDPDARTLLRKIESVKLEKGKITFTPKAKDDAAAPAPDAAAGAQKPAEQAPAEQTPAQAPAAEEQKPAA